MDHSKSFLYTRRRNLYDMFSSQNNSLDILIENKIKISQILTINGPQKRITVGHEALCLTYFSVFLVPSNSIRQAYLNRVGTN